MAQRVGGAGLMRRALLSSVSLTLKGGELKREKSYMCMKMTNLLTFRSLAYFRTKKKKVKWGWHMGVGATALVS